MQKTHQILWQDFKNGNKDAFTKIYESNYRYLYTYGHCFTSSSDLVKDAIQEIFSELWQNRKKVASVTEIRSYLLVYLKRKILSSKKQVKPAPLEYPVDEKSFESLLIDQENNNMMKVIISDSLAHLTSRQREVIYLKFYVGLDYKDISKITSIKYQSVRNLMHEAIKALKKNMKHLIY